MLDNMVIYQLTDEGLKHLIDEAVDTPIYGVNEEGYDDVVRTESTIVYQGYEFTTHWAFPEYGYAFASTLKGLFQHDPFVSVR